MPIQITPFTTTPSRQNPATFSADMDVRLSQENSRIVEMNLQSTENNKINDNVNIKEASAVLSANSAAASSLSAQGSANYQGAWTPKGYTLGQTVSDANGIRWLCKLTHTTAQTATEGTYWTIAIPYVGAIGNINSPLLDMPLKNSLALKAGVGSATFTRASTATYIDRYGVLKTAAINEPRFEKEGYLNEGNSTNLLIYSEQFDNAAWTKVATTIIANTTDTLDPYGTNLADKLVESTALSYHYFAQNIVVTAGTAYTTSIFLKAGERSKARVETYNTIDGSKVVDIDLLTGVATSAQTFKVAPLANGWYRVSVTSTPTTTALALRVLLNDPATGAFTTYTGDGTSGVYIFGGSLEALPFATSYIPTVASTATRAADVESTTKYGNFPSLGGDFTLALDAKSLYSGASSSRYLFSVGTTTSDKVTIHQHNAAGALTVYYGNDLVYYNTAVSLSSKTRLVLTKSGSAAKLYANGVQIASVTLTTQIENASSSFYIGSLSGAGQFYGNIDNVRIFDKSLTAQEVALC